MVNYRELRMDDDDISEYISLFNQVFSGEKMTENLFRWKNLDNPCGPSIITVAEESDRFIGACSFWASHLLLDNQPVLCYQSCDTMVHPSFRRSGVFSMIIPALEMVRGRGGDMVYGFPNENSFPLFRKLGWTCVGEMETVLIPIAPVASLTWYFRRRLGLGIRSSGRQWCVGEPTGPASSVTCGRITVRTASPLECVNVSDILDRLLHRFVLPERTLGIFLWRYKQRPNRNYWYVVFERADVVLGYAVLDVYLTDLVMCNLVELQTLPDLVGDLLAALRAFLAYQGVHLLYTATLGSQLRLGVLGRLSLPILTRRLPGLVCREVVQGHGAPTMRWWVWPGMADTA